MEERNRKPTKKLTKAKIGNNAEKYVSSEVTGAGGLRAARAIRDKGAINI